jgi:hypothetical protein
MMNRRLFNTAWLLLAGMGLLTGALLGIGPAPADAYRLPDSGQTKCYDNAGNEITCPAPGERFHGQDGNYSGPQPAYKDNGNGTVTDLNTGLMWQQGDAHNSSGRTWQQAVDYCAASGLADYHDWRLPSITELTSIVDHSRTNPAVNTTYFPGCRSSVYWSGTTVAGYPGYAWGVNFYYGYDHWFSKDNTSYVRCVRGGP